MPPAVAWACPLCRGPLGAEWQCPVCHRAFAGQGDKQPDFRITEPIRIDETYRYDPAFGRFPWDRVSLAWPDAGAGLNSQVSWAATERQMLRAIPVAIPGQVALDIGCGEVRQRFREGLQRLGYAPLGIDIAGAAPDALADAHRLPLADASVDVVMTSAVFEHLKHPHVAMAEIARVLRPGGRVLGSVAFGEPFHISYFHHSPLAVFDLLDSCGLDAEVIVLDDGYSAFYAHLEMGYAGQRIPRPMHAAVANVVRVLALLPARLKGILRGSPEHLERARVAFARSHAASVGFVARRPSTAT